ncbi:MAG TPA: NADPH-dependent FMN reductase [Xanthobacteraceae bacterium]|nr:NADPH-dependent FMN reductase [Xanthobacteraceae bacterium]
MADNTLNVLSICGSLRKGSYNAALMRTLPSLAPEGMSIKPAPAWDKMPIYNFDIQNEHGFPADVTAWADAIRGADGIIIVSPEYNWTIPGGLKNAIDWVSRLKDVPFKEKPVALQSCAGGVLGGARMQYHMRQCLTSIDAFLYGKPEILVTFAAKKFDEKTLALTDQPTIDIVKQQLAGFEKFIRRHHHHGTK